MSSIQLDKQIVDANIGKCIKGLRDEHKLSLRALAEKSGLSINAISQIERGEVSPTVSTLNRLARAFGISVADFFYQENARRTVFVKKNRGMLLEVNGICMERLGTGLAQQHFEPYRMVLQPDGGELGNGVSHPGQEFVYCLEGEVEYRIDSQTYRLESGDSLSFEASQSHSWRNPAHSPATILVVFNAWKEPNLGQQAHMEGVRFA